MTDEKIREVLELYEDRVFRAVLPKMLTPESARWYHDTELQHLLTMIPKMREMIEKQWPQWDPAYNGGLRLEQRHALNREKLMRWLGFLQGVLYSKGIFTIDEMRKHNMPEGEVFRERQP